MNPLVNLAKKAVETYIKDGKIIELTQDLPTEFLNRQAGVFVTINTKYQLRGCIGTYLPTRINIAEEVVKNAIAAASEDYRFSPIQKDELPYLSYTVYILNTPEQIKDLKDPTKSSEEEFRRAGLNYKKFGIIVKSGTKCGLLLPDLDGVDTVKQQISICCQKGGIDLEKEKIFIYKFGVEKYD